MQKSSSESPRLPMYVWILILAALVVSLVFLASSFYIYEQNLEWAGYLLLGGALLLFMSTYTLFQARRRVLRKRIESPPITTTMECKACGFKSVREFQRGDYIFKEGTECQKCKSKTLITAIYREVRERDKEKITL